VKAPKRQGPLARALSLSVVGWLILLLWPEARNMLVLQARLIARTEPSHAGYVTPWLRPGG